MITLVGYGVGYEQVARDFGCRIIPGLDMNLVEMPLIGSLMEIAMNASEDVSVLVNSDILLTQSFADGIGKVIKHFTDWFLTGARIDLMDLPSFFDPHSKTFSDSSFTNFARSKGVLHSAGGLDYFVWNNNGRKLINGVFPPFIHGKSKCE